MVVAVGVGIMARGFRDRTTQSCEGRELEASGVLGRCVLKGRRGGLWIGPLPRSERTSGSGRREGGVYLDKVGLCHYNELDRGSVMMVGYHLHIQDWWH